MNDLYLEFAKKIQSLAQTGLTYAINEYDIERYEQLRTISFEMMETISNAPVHKIKDLFKHETGYQTPKADVRGIIFRNNKVLMVQEKIDQNWAPPGGWADVGLTPNENAKKEVWEESGLIVEPVKLLAVLDKKCHDHPPSPWYTYKFFILCKETGGKLKAGTETLDARFFGRDELPPLSIERITSKQMDMIFEFLDNPDKDAVCE